MNYFVKININIDQIFPDSKEMQESMNDHV